MNNSAHGKPLRALIWCAVSSKPQAADDKISLEVQERDARAWCDANGYQVVAVLKVPGYSRRESDVITALEDFASQGIYAYQQLREMWQRHEFDVLVAYAHDRLGRSNTLHSFVVENVILSGAQIYLLMDGGYVDLEDFRYKLAIGGMMAAAPVDRMVKARKEGMKARAQRGLPVSSRIPMSHIRVRDPKTGRDVGMEVDESKRRLWDDLATLVLEGVSWFKIEQELYKRFGHVDERGNLYYPNHFYKLIMKPIFWGHIAQHHNSTNVPNGFKLGRWIYDESIPLPEGVTIFRNTHPAVWTGELAEQIQAEIMRRTDVVRGRATPHMTKRFTGLVVCGECMRVMSTRVDTGTAYRGLLCKAGTTLRFMDDCSNGKIINEKKVMAYLDGALRQFIAKDNTAFLENANTEATIFSNRLDNLNDEIAHAEKQVGVLIREQASASEDVQPFYRSEINKLTQQLRGLNSARLELEQQTVAAQRSNAARETTREELVRLSIDGFWQQDSRTINQMLHRLMGTRRLVVMDGEVVGTVLKPYRNRRPKLPAALP